MRKPVFWISDQALVISAVKPPKKRKRVEILDKGSRGIILSAMFVAKKGADQLHSNRAANLRLHYRL